MQAESGKLVSVIIVTTGVKDYLWRCLDSIKCQSHRSLEVIVIDNSCNPDFSSAIPQHFSPLKLCVSERNMFYCASLNRGIGLSSGEFVLCLNDDVVLDKEFIKEALKGFFLKERIGMVSGKLLRRDGSLLDSAGLFLSIWRTAKERGYGRKDSGRFEKEGFIFGVNGAAAFYRRKMLDEVKEKRGYFDERFRIFYEDLDIAWRAQRKHWQAYYIPRAIAYHARGGTVRSEKGVGKAVARRYLSNQLHADLIKNRYLAILKNESAAGFFLYLVPMILHELAAWTYILLRRPGVIRALSTRPGLLREGKS